MMITAPSIIIPKSMAPKLIRLAQTLNCFISMNAKSSESGIVVAVMIPPRKLPNRMTSANMTMSAPSIRLVCTVLVVLEIRSLLSMMVLISNPSGSDFSTSSIRSFTFCMTALGLEPFSIMMMPPTDSRPSCVNAP